MLVCTCCGQWKIKVDQPVGLYRIRHYGFIVADVRTVDEITNVLDRYGLTLADFEDTNERT
jgi:hypothetical protein